MDTRLFITELATALRPVKQLPYIRIGAEWLVITVIALAGIGALYGFRPDLATRMANPLFSMELALNAMLIAIAGSTAIACCYPDRAKAPFLKLTLVAIAIGYSVLIGISVAKEPVQLNDALNHAPHSIECLLCILSFAAIPALWLFWRLRKLACMRPVLVGAIAVMAAIATGCLGVRLVETGIIPAGFALWHYMPLVLLTTVGLLLGNKIFRW